MTLLLAIVTGILFTAGFYLVLRRSLVKVIFGLMFLGHAANLLIFNIGRLTKGAPAFILEGNQTAVEPYAEPIPQALILTAIVIGFGVQAFAIVLFKKAYQMIGSDDINSLKSTDRIA
ncbi:MAG: Na+/H+ antiporter subunit C [Ignavibacteriae bacterium HGW-Ignavibacteriae-1]|jgi:multicomponent Na+:H+ antiporter subunit C|nr:MAG: Na+/H+ antiporter subunit C [Ignavibacteriae bacterium HGW-Ignavibacteriae-1]